MRAGSVSAALCSPVKSGYATWKAAPAVHLLFGIRIAVPGAVAVLELEQRLHADAAAGVDGQAARIGGRRVALERVAGGPGNSVLLGSPHGQRTWILVNPDGVVVSGCPGAHTAIPEAAGSAVTRRFPRL